MRPIAYYIWYPPRTAGPRPTSTEMDGCLYSVLRTRTRTRTGARGAWAASHLRRIDAHNRRDPIFGKPADPAIRFLSLANDRSPRGQSIPVCVLHSWALVPVNCEDESSVFLQALSTRSDTLYGRDPAMILTQLQVRSSSQYEYSVLYSVLPLVLSQPSASAEQAKRSISGR